MLALEYSPLCLNINIKPAKHVIVDLYIGEKAQFIYAMVWTLNSLTLQLKFHSL